jgi:hypothetical protein
MDRFTERFENVAITDKQMSDRESYRLFAPVVVCLVIRSLKTTNFLYFTVFDGWFFANVIRISFAFQSRLEWYLFLVRGVLTNITIFIEHIFCEIS